MDNEEIKNKSESYWQEKLDPDRYHILREAGTEAPFTGKFWNNHEKGMYVCGACGHELGALDSHENLLRF